MVLSLLMKQEKGINMKAKLIKKRTGIYKLESNGEVIASSDIDMNNDLQLTKLSLKNCQAIENGYDLDELAKDSCSKLYGREMNGRPHLWDEAFSRGFQKALEILCDKKFSEGQMKSLFAKTLESSLSTESHTRMISDTEYRHFLMDEMYNRIIKSLYQTEWDCIIEMEQITLPFGANQFITESKPKLDADGCLILKKL